MEMCSATSPTTDQLKDDETELLIQAGYEHVKGALYPQPISRPKFSITDLRNAIPAHCFERSMVKSFGYLSFDILAIILLLWSAYVGLEEQSLPYHMDLIAYPVYWFIQGSFMFGLWVLAHECGNYNALSYK